MNSIDVDSLRFRFPAGWSVTKYDDWSYYRNQFIKLRKGIKGVDLIALDINKTVWFIEAKDYRDYKRRKEQPIDEEVRDKVFSTLAGVLAAKFNANSSEENDLAKKTVTAEKIRIVLHLEQPLTESKLYNPLNTLANVQQRLRSLLKCIDPHLLVVDSSKMDKLSWSVTTAVRTS